MGKKEKEGNFSEELLPREITFHSVKCGKTESGRMFLKTVVTLEPTSFGLQSAFKLPPSLTLSVCD